jgi:protease II
MQQINTEKTVICSSCRLKFTDVPSYKLHRSTEFHNYNTKRQIANLEPISEELFEEKRVMLQQSNISVSTETKWKCKACSKIFKTIESLDEHKRSKKHKKNEKEFLDKNPNSELSSIFKSITHETSDFLSDLNKSLQKQDVSLTFI